ncbi:PepSY-associated TM helix domain-containing protein [Pedobacter punctiformis]|uniref:PepSY-associated TM helix domain-containing protein n=1 Tax=Pedobacter punctiformis TaxID=3004097 RepID=A0ABT4L4H1_9SPHI|nr:PepSY-associated TM helix domain-containing protein [Pedobacter sp. HCMS5-2]MCZ4242814.1 PepSY-associated TM helix domain-containing protein [Pedobacter sp. HCMS5-2]
MATTKQNPKAKSKKSRFRRISDWLHLWLGITSSLIVIIIAITGCIFVFQKEITETIHRKEFFVQVPVNPKTLPLSVLTANAEKALGNGKKIGFLSTYKEPERAWEFGTFKGGDPKAFFYFDAVAYYDMVLVNPYTGKVTLVSDYKYNFFNIIKMLHWSLLINHPIGQQIIGWSTFIFVILLITGMIMWWPKNLRKSNFDKSFKIKWKAKFKRVNYDLHNVPGFYAMLICLVLALTGMVWAFKWFQTTVYVVASRSITPPPLVTGKSDSTQTSIINPFDIAFEQAKQKFKDADRIGMSPAIGGGSAVIYASGYRGGETYYDYDELQFDQYSGKLLNRRNYSEKNAGEKIIGMNYDIHVGAILGLPGKILAFIASLIAASLPITGFIIWWGKKKKKKTPAAAETK